MKRLTKKPFALLGVNLDESPERLKIDIEKMKITWRSFFDGGSNDGPIATQWSVNRLPTTYIIDHNGKIRFQDLPRDQLDAAVDQLLREMKKK